MKNIIPSARNRAGAFIVFTTLLAAANANAEKPLSKFDADNALDGQYAGWESVEPSLKGTNWTITATGFGGAWKNLNPSVDASGETIIELGVIIESTNEPPASVTAGPLVVLADEDGTQWVWAWYGQKAGRHLLKKDLKSPTKKQEAGTVPGMDFSKLKAFHVQVDPGTSKTAYRLKFQELRLTSPTDKAARTE